MAIKINNACSVIGIHRTSFETKDRGTVYGYTIYFTTPLLGDHDEGSMCGQLYVSADLGQKMGLEIGMVISVARVNKDGGGFKYELVAE